MIACVRPLVEFHSSPIHLIGWPIKKKTNEWKLAQQQQKKSVVWPGRRLKCERTKDTPETEKPEIKMKINQRCITTCAFYRLACLFVGWCVCLFTYLTVCLHTWIAVVGRWVRFLDDLQQSLVNPISAVGLHNVHTHTHTCIWLNKWKIWSALEYSGHYTFICIHYRYVPTQTLITSRPKMNSNINAIPLYTIWQIIRIWEMGKFTERLVPTKYGMKSPTRKQQCRCSWAKDDALIIIIKENLYGNTCLVWMCENRWQNGKEKGASKP